MGRARRRAPTAAAAALALALLAPACTAGESGPSPSRTAVAPVPTSSASAAPAPEPTTPDGPPLHGAEEVGTGAPVPVWDEAAREQARTVAGDAMRAYARPRAGVEQWWAELEGFFTPGARHDYQWVQPGSVLATAVTAEPEVVEEPSVYLARVDVTTDVGVYQVLLSRQDGPTAWLVERIVPPEGVG